MDSNGMTEHELDMYAELVEQYIADGYTQEMAEEYAQAAMEHMDEDDEQDDYDGDYDEQDDYDGDYDERDDWDDDIDGREADEYADKIFPDCKSLPID
jgi:hypothetical protein